MKYLLALLAFLTLCGSAFGTYTYKQEITVSASAAKTNIPVEVVLNADDFDFSHCRSDFYDLEIRASDETTALNYYRMYYLDCRPTGIDDAMSPQGTSWNYVQPQAYYYSSANTCTYVVYMDDARDTCVSKFDHTTKLWADSVQVYTEGEANNHAASCIFVDSSGYIHVIGGEYTGAADGLKHYKSTNPEDISAWGDAGTIENVEALTLPYALVRDNGDIWLFSRDKHGANDSRTALNISTDDGANWQTMKHIIDSDERPYFGGAVEDDSGNIWIAWTHSNAGGSSENTYCAKCVGAASGTWKAADDTVVTAPFDGTEAETCVAATASNSETFPVDITLVDDKPLIVYNDDTGVAGDWTLKTAKWSGSAWSTHTVYQHSYYPTEAAWSYLTAELYSTSGTSNVTCYFVVGEGSSGEWNYGGDILAYASTDAGSTWTASATIKTLDYKHDWADIETHFNRNIKYARTTEGRKSTATACRFVFTETFGGNWDETNTGEIWAYGTEQEEARLWAKMSQLCTSDSLWLYYGCATDSTDASTRAIMYLWDDFETYADGDRNPTGWVTGSKGEVEIDDAYARETLSNKAWASEGGDSANAYWYIPFGTTMSVDNGHEIYWSWLVDDLDEGVLAALMPDSTVGASATVWMKMDVNNTDISYYDGEWKDVLTSLSAEQWYVFKVYNVDFTNHQFDIDVATDHGVTGTNANGSFRDGTNSQITRFFANNGDINEHEWFDDIVAYPVTSISQTFGSETEVSPTPSAMEAIIVTFW